ncbi:properdin [Harpia harpyja]|uniref:properdin n=1 Tax=Harpia harpyja TaxID=202280 RepID=UPI0022B18DD8|nr:properdin [Harpia harpyja]
MGPVGQLWGGAARGRGQSRGGVEAVAVIRRRLRRTRPAPPAPATPSTPNPALPLPPCPVDGAWGAWSATAPCPVTCGLGAVTWRRACDAPPPQHGGRRCHGNSMRQGGLWTPRALPSCAALGPVGRLDPLRAAAVGHAELRAHRGAAEADAGECVGRKPGGPPCLTEGGVATIQIRACYNIHHCLLAGNWSDWSPWGLCTPPCGASPTRSRTRECQPIYPAYPLTVTPVGSSVPVNVTFWGSARPRCPPPGGGNSCAWRRVGHACTCCPAPPPEED